jgi:hypothetical protein
LDSDGFNRARVTRFLTKAFGLIAGERVQCEARRPFNQAGDCAVSLRKYVVSTVEMKIKGKRCSNGLEEAGSVYALFRNTLVSSLFDFKQVIPRGTHSPFYTEA